MGVKNFVKTDHNNQKYFLTQKNLSPEQQKWLSKIQVFYFDVLYKKGNKNVVAYSLSRKHECDALLCTISLIILEWISKVQTKYVKDPEIRKLIEEVERNKATKSKYSWEKDTSWCKQRIYLL